jgi:hypothetical protein
MTIVSTCSMFTLETRQHGGSVVPQLGRRIAALQDEGGGQPARARRWPRRVKSGVCSWKVLIGSPAKVSRPSDTTSASAPWRAMRARACSSAANQSATPVRAGSGRLRLQPCPAPAPVSSAWPR